MGGVFVIIKRFLESENLDRMKNDFKFLFKMMKDENHIGELDMAFRDNCFNLYYKGNSLARITFGRGNSYNILIHEKFFSNTGAYHDTRFSAAKKDNSFKIILDKKLLHPFFQTNYVDQILSNIRKVNNGEEITLEQTIITDNLDREDIIIIDRQIADKTWKRRMDLLALVHVNENEYYFRVIEVKLGNNPELKNKVGSQLKEYISHIGQNFNDYKVCYEKQYKQKKELNLFSVPKHKSIKIVQPVKGLVVVVGYSGIAKGRIAQLKINHSGLAVKSFVNLL
jgi:CRISPR/Cas system-associated exonuclease Cas4 (RecB family)